ncbi:hypothetical protein N7448_001902 [Penicillium atrosanguineum]|uniref:Methyltransferase type 11 domain-containing protein n=1 Tax=Penicillium atrosanguineum TaxID=1132637 RepID=A0A9W9HK01_9EURO|nr:uncharacterized protein N7443_005300 [Penicillium atrosanguineum]KAJ5150324.1 hypothetical protein N7448_001902 [Penicillium atrosanguineum]KAJ5305640.1 hypothetical protein N7443_005300 [Penicillium atrosanguineum]KAJ5325102.1 hypothetical protein N7476_003702 [Penicillium atrosanguineum]
MAEGNNFDKPAWYQTEVQSINAEAQRLLESYSSFRPDEVLPHVLKLRDEAFSICDYPCIGQLRFLSFSLPEHTVYSRVLTRLREDPTAGFLEAGCCFGQEIRYLADQGIPGIQLMGCDVEPAFFDLGYKLFRDQDTLGATFVSGDLTSEQCLEPSTDISRYLASKVDIVFASSLFHLWNYECQVRASINLVRLCRDKPGVMVVGRQLGSVLAGHYSMKDVGKGANYRHNIETLKGLWYDVGEATNTRWTVEAGLYIGSELAKVKDSAWADANDRMIWWCVTRQ